MFHLKLHMKKGIKATKIIAFILYLAGP